MSKVVVDYTIRHIYKDYKKTIGLVNEDVFKQLTYAFNKRVVNGIIEKGKSFRVPGKIGDLKIVKFKVPLQLNDKGELDTKRLSVDYNASWKYWFKLYGTTNKQEILNTTKPEDRPKIYHYNEHTSGYAFRWKWDKIDTRLDITAYYTFKPVRNNRLKLNKFVLGESLSTKMYEFSIPRSKKYGST